MFVLITAECEVISCETKVETFATHKQAHDAMVCDAKQRAQDAGIPNDELGMYIDCIGDDGGYIMDVVGWQIREIPGAFIPAEAARNLHECIREAADAYGDESRFDCYDADLTCQEVCWELDGFLGVE